MTNHIPVKVYEEVTPEILLPYRHFTVNRDSVLIDEMQIINVGGKTYIVTTINNNKETKQ